MCLFRLVPPWPELARLRAGPSSSSHRAGWAAGPGRGSLSSSPLPDQPRPARVSRSRRKTNWTARTLKSPERTGRPSSWTPVRGRQRPSHSHTTQTSTITTLTQRISSVSLPPLQHTFRPDFSSAPRKRQQTYKQGHLKKYVYFHILFCF